MTQIRPFAAGSAVVLYSDGITDAQNEAGKEFENDCREALLRESMDVASNALCDRIAAAVDQFVGAAPQKDDQTLVVARTQGVPRSG